MRNYILYIAICILLSMLLGFTLVRSKMEELSTLKEDIEVKEIDLQSQENYFESLQTTSEELKKYESSLSKIDSALPKEFSLPEILNFVQTASSQSGLSLKVISPALTAYLQKEKPTKITRLNLILAGNYNEFKTFLSLLENSSRLIEVENVSFIYPEEGSFNFNLTIAVYSY